MGTQIVLDLYHRIQRCFFPNNEHDEFCWNLEIDRKMLKLFKNKS